MNPMFVWSTIDCRMVVVKMRRKISSGLRGIRSVGPTCLVNGRTITGLRIRTVPYLHLLRAELVITSREPDLIEIIIQVVLSIRIQQSNHILCCHEGPTTAASHPIFSIATRRITLFIMYAAMLWVGLTSTMER